MRLAYYMYKTYFYNNLVLRLTLPYLSVCEDVMLTPPDSKATKVFLKHTPAGPLSNRDMCTGAHCCLCSLPISGDNLNVLKVYHKSYMAKWVELQIQL